MALAETEPGEGNTGPARRRGARLKQHVTNTKHTIPDPEQEAPRATLNSHLHLVLSSKRLKGCLLGVYASLKYSD